MFCTENSQQIGTSSNHSTDDDMNEPKRMRTDVTTDYTKVTKIECTSSDNSGHTAYGNQIIDLD